MAIFQKEETLFEQKDIRLGELNYNSPTGTCYDNVLTFGFAVKKKRFVHLTMTADKPIDVVLARSDNSVAQQMLQVSEATMGPVPTDNDTDMGVLIGTFPGNKVTVSLRVWMDTK